MGQAIRDRRDRVVLATKCGLIWDREEGTLHFYADDQGATLRPVDKKIYKNLRPASIREEVERQPAAISRPIASISCKPTGRTPARRWPTPWPNSSG